MQKKQDLRTIRTQEHMREALLELMSEKQVSEITVKELAERAQISRGTFYLYFDSVEDMLATYEEEIFSEYEDEIHRIIVESETFEEVLRKLIAYPFPQNEHMRPLIRLMYGKNGNMETLLRGSAILEREILRYFQSDLPEWNFRFLITFVSNGMISAFRLWFQEENNYSVEELTNLVLRTLYGIDSITASIRKKR